MQFQVRYRSHVEFSAVVDADGEIEARGLTWERLDGLPPQYAIVTPQGVVFAKFDPDHCELLSVEAVPVDGAEAEAEADAAVQVNP